MNDKLRAKLQKREEIRRINKIVHEYNYENNVTYKNKVEGYYTIDLNTINLFEIQDVDDLIRVADNFVLKSKEAPIELANHIKWRFSKEYRNELNNGVREDEIKTKNKYEGFSAAKSRATYFGLYESLDKEKLYMIVKKYK